MGSVSEFASLVRLLDDDSAMVRTAVAKRLLDYEEELPDIVTQLDPLPSPDHFAMMNRLIREAKCETLIDHWVDIMSESDAITRLEQSLGLLADYIDGERFRTGKLTKELDTLADQLRTEGMARNPLLVVQALFQSGRFIGNRDDYYAPQNSSMTSVIADGLGNPISLVCLFILVGHRLDMTIEGCNYPGHFLALIQSHQEPVMIDCFNGGQIVSLEDLMPEQEVALPELKEALNEGAAVEVILLRVLRNLQRAFHQKGSEHEQSTIEHLIEQMLVSGLV